jgi:hypothetical protein
VKHFDPGRLAAFEEYLPHTSLRPWPADRDEAIESLAALPALLVIASLEASTNSSIRRPDRRLAWQVADRLLAGDRPAFSLAKLNGFLSQQSEELGSAVKKTRWNEPFVVRTDSKIRPRILAYRRLSELGQRLQSESSEMASLGRLLASYAESSGFAVDCLDSRGVMEWLLAEGANAFQDERPSFTGARPKRALRQAVKNKRCYP